MQGAYDVTPERIICINCYTKAVAFRDKEGVIKHKCSKCGTVTVSKIKSRRHITLEVYAPKGQVYVGAMEN